MRSLANLVESLHDEFDFRIVAADRDVGDSHGYEGVKVGQWTHVGNSQVYYVVAGSKTLSQIAKVLLHTEYDVLYLNSFFDPLFTLWPLLLRRMKSVPTKPFIVAPRGEFSAGALHIKRWKKSLYLPAVRRIGLYSRAIWQASSEFEASQIMHAMGPIGVSRMQDRVEGADGIRQVALSVSSDDHGLDVVVAPNVSQYQGASVEKSQPRSGGEVLRVCFLSRIVPMKNLKYALQVLSEVQRPVHFNIYGPQEDKKYWTECELLISALPTHVRATYCGVVEQVRVVDVLAEHDLFFLPTKGENFGHVIHESLRAGTPVLVSDQTPWTGLQNEGVGTVLPLGEPARFARAIEESADWDDTERHRIRLAARRYAQSIGHGSTAVEANRILFRKAVSLGQSPPKR